MHTQIKICGITRLEDALAAVALGADALGFVFYHASPRYIAPGAAAAIVRALPPFTQTVGLFVNAPREEVAWTLQTVPLSLLQFHGDEDEAYCAGFARPYLKAARVGPETRRDDLLQYAVSFPSARALLFDALVTGYGGGGKTFDWDLLRPDDTEAAVGTAAGTMIGTTAAPRLFSLPVVLSGGLTPENVETAVRRVRPAAVDVSSGVEAVGSSGQTIKGIKDHAKIAAFIAGVRNAEH